MIWKTLKLISKDITNFQMWDPMWTNLLGISRSSAFWGRPDFRTTAGHPLDRFSWSGILHLLGNIGISCLQVSITSKWQHRKQMAPTTPSNNKKKLKYHTQNQSVQNTFACLAIPRKSKAAVFYSTGSAELPKG